MRKHLLTLLLLLPLGMGMAQAAQRTWSEATSQAMDLYERGLFYEAAQQFTRISREYGSVEAKGYAVLCRVTLRAGGYEKETDAFLDEFPALPVSYRIILRYAYNRFDDEDYATALKYLNRLTLEDIDRSQYPEFTFKKAYCHFELGDYAKAAEGFEHTLALPRSTYYAPARYALGYIAYQKNQFKKAYHYFSLAKTDSRFTANSLYYMLECRFMDGDYDYVVEQAEEAFDTIPEERKPRLARMLSEIYLVWQDPVNAQKYYDLYLVKEEPKTRKDYFYAASLLYAVEDYEGAAEKFEGMKYRGDSLGQVANYQMADCYIRMKNKVAAMQAFKDAAGVEFDPRITEDAFFNYAKLAFDLNKDGSGFRNYLEKYKAEVRGEQIYSYMALAYLQDKQYDLAIEYYDKIDEFDGQMKDNYMKANYLRGAQLLSDGSCRLAAEHFRWASIYAEKNSPLAQNANYYLADACYRDGKYAQAAKIYTDLYNTSALSGTPRQQLIVYGLAYSYYKQQDYPAADKWFARYAAYPDAVYRKNAVVRRGDASFARNKYKDALAFYLEAVSMDDTPDDIYPYYQAGVCSGLLGDRNGRIDALVRVRQASPQAPFYSEALYELGRAYVDAGRNTGATESFTQLVETGRDTTYVSKALLALGMLSRNAGDTDRALAYYRRVVETMPLSGSSADAMAAIEALYQEKGDSEGYLAWLDKVGKGESKTEEDKERIIFNSAEQLFLSGNWDRALASLSAFKDAYPSSAMRAKADFYCAESYRNKGEKEKARDAYSAVVESADTSLTEPSMLAFARLSYEMQLYDDAYGAYRALERAARFDENKEEARKGLMYAAWFSKRYESAVVAADVFLGSPAGQKHSSLKEDALYIKAMSLLSTSKRPEAMAIFKQLAAKPKTARGAEATYMLVKDAYERADYAAVEDLTADFSDSGTTQVYYLAKAVIILCDAYLEKGDANAAKDNLIWIRDSYRSNDPADDILPAVHERLAKIESNSSL